ncbi:MAG: hypothetical protein RAK22_03120, partial [Nanoarchaeota archaeon]|nr:hypothetical protein [Nanoarchaeota archaeon]
KHKILLAALLSYLKARNGQSYEIKVSYAEYTLQLNNNTWNADLIIGYEEKDRGVIELIEVETKNICDPRLTQKNTHGNELYRVHEKENKILEAKHIQTNNVFKKIEDVDINTIRFSIAMDGGGHPYEEIEKSVGIFINELNRLYKQPEDENYERYKIYIFNRPPSRTNTKSPKEMINWIKKPNVYTSFIENAWK